MADNKSWSWDEMTDAFRKIGGAIENLRPGDGDAGDDSKPAGPGLFAVDPQKEIRIYVPPKLLVPADEVRIENGQLVLAAESSVEPAVREFFERFQAAYGFGAGAGARCRSFFAELAALPDRIKQHIAPALPPDIAAFRAPDDRSVLMRFLRSRVVSFGGKPVMPMVAELINHGAEQPFFDLSQGLKHTGKFGGEVLTRYSGGDAWDAFLTLGIASLQVPAFSLPMEMRAKNGKALFVGRRTDASEMLDNVLVPRSEERDDGLALAHALLGHRRVPGLPRAAFRRVLQDRNLGDADESFDLLSHLNRVWFVDLLGMLDGRTGTVERTMRAAALCQLTALSHAIGAAVRGESGPKPMTFQLPN